MSTIDDFEDNDISEYSGDTGQFSTQTGTVESGTYALETTGSGYDTMFSTSGLDTYPQQGDTFEYYFRFGSAGSEGGMAFAYDGSGQEYYRIYVSDGQKFEINKWVAGSDSTIAGGASQLSSDNGTGEWFRAEVEWNDGDSDIVAHIYDSTDTEVGGSPITASGETDYNHTGIGWEFDGSKMYFDSASLSALRASMDVGTVTAASPEPTA